MSENDPQADARRFSAAVQAYLARSSSPVREFHAIAAEDGLHVQWVGPGFPFGQVHLHAPDWLERWTQLGDEFVIGVVSSLPKRAPDEESEARARRDLLYLFARMMQDLSHVATSVDDYDNRRVAAILRVILLEGMAHKVNNALGRQEKLTFEVGWTLRDPIEEQAKRPTPRGPHLRIVDGGRRFQAVEDRIDPNQFEEASSLLEWDDFLSAYVVTVEGHYVSVRELVQHLAFVEGVVHFGGPRPSRPADTELQMWRRMMAFPGRRPLFTTIAAVGRVVLHTLGPLVAAAIEAVRKADGHPTIRRAARANTSLDTGAE